MEREPTLGHSRQPEEATSHSLGFPHARPESRPGLVPLDPPNNSAKRSRKQKPSLGKGRRWFQARRAWECRPVPTHSPARVLPARCGPGGLACFWAASRPGGVGVRTGRHGIPRSAGPDPRDQPQPRTLPEPHPVDPGGRPGPSGHSVRGECPGCTPFPTRDTHPSPLRRSTPACVLAWRRAAHGVERREGVTSALGWSGRRSPASH